MNDIGPTRHVIIFLALVVNLWVGGDYIEVWAGGVARTVFELTLILGWMTLVIGMRAPLPWRRRRDEEGRSEDRR